LCLLRRGRLHIDPLRGRRRALRRLHDRDGADRHHPAEHPFSFIEINNVFQILHGTYFFPVFQKRNNYLRERVHFQQDQPHDIFVTLA